MLALCWSHVGSFWLHSGSSWPQDASGLLQVGSSGPQDPPNGSQELPRPSKFSQKGPGRAAKQHKGAGASRSMLRHVPLGEVWELKNVLDTPLLGRAWAFANVLDAPRSGIKELSLPVHLLRRVLSFP